VVKEQLVPTFANAQYVVHKGEFDHAHQPTERDRASYLPDNFEPMKRTGQWLLIDRDQEIAPGVELFQAAGHTANMMCVKLSGGGKAAVLLADLAPTRAHLQPAWIMGYDLYPMTTLENKKRWILEIIRRGWLALFAHDREVRAAHLREEDGKIVAEPVAVN
jgi:glyoxylase-like metal-dependent hydrolase (beta-lactamase superfamily II)